MIKNIIDCKEIKLANKLKELNYFFDTIAIDKKDNIIWIFDKDDFNNNIDTYINAKNFNL